MSKSVTVVIVSYHTGPILARVIESVLKQENLEELVIVDNGNPEEVTEKLLKLSEENPKIQIMTGHGNIGFASGCNLGASKAKGSYLLMLNPDCMLVEPDTLSKAVEYMKAEPEAWLLGCRMRMPDGSLHKGNKRNLLTPKVLFMQGSGFHRLIHFSGFVGINIKEEESETEPHFVPAISGAFMLMNLARFRDIGGMDEKYFFHVEDLDLCMRIYKKGGKILYVPEIQPIHFRSSSKVSSLFVQKHKTLGLLRYFKKHYENPRPPHYPKAFHPLRYRFTILLIYLQLWLNRFLIIMRSAYDKNKSNSKLHREKKIQELLNEETTLEKLSLKKHEPVFLTGSTGNVGINILRRLIANNIETHALFHFSAINIDKPNLNWVHGDLATGFLNLENVNAKTLISTTEIWNLPESLSKFEEIGIKRLVCFSCTSLDGKAETKNIYEKNVVEKLEWGEKMVVQECTRLGIEFTILRPTMIYGYGLDHNVSRIANFIKKLHFFPVYGGATGLRQPVHSEDLAIAALKIINKPKTHGKTYDLPGKTSISYKDMLKKIFPFTGKKERIFKVSFLPYVFDLTSFFVGKKGINGDMARRMNHDLAFDGSEAKKDFAFKSREFLNDGKKDLGL